MCKSANVARVQTCRLANVANKVLKDFFLSFPSHFYIITFYMHYISQQLLGNWVGKKKNSLHTTVTNKQSLLYFRGTFSISYMKESEHKHMTQESHTVHTYNIPIREMKTRME